MTFGLLASVLPLFDVGTKYLRQSHWNLLSLHSLAREIKLSDLGVSSSTRFLISYWHHAVSALLDSVMFRQPPSQYFAHHLQGGQETPRLLLSSGLRFPTGASASRSLPHMWNTHGWKSLRRCSSEMLSRTKGFPVCNCFLWPEVNMWDTSLNPTKCGEIAGGMNKESKSVCLHMSLLIYTLKTSP